MLMSEVEGVRHTGDSVGGDVAEDAHGGQAFQRESRSEKSRLVVQSLLPRRGVPLELRKTRACTHPPRAHSRQHPGCGQYRASRSRHP